MTRLEFVTHTLNLLGPDTEWTVESAMDQWWVDSRTHSGMRLTNAAQKIAKQTGQESWTFQIPKSTPFLPRTLLVLNNHLTCAYWLELKRPPGIELFGSREATLFSLYQDINQFIRALGR